MCALNKLVLHSIDSWILVTFKWTNISKSLLLQITLQEWCPILSSVGNELCTILENEIDLSFIILINIWQQKQLKFLWFYPIERIIFRRRSEILTKKIRYKKNSQDFPTEFRFYSIFVQNKEQKYFLPDYS